MTLISIRQTDGQQATVSFDQQGFFPITISDPFSEAEENHLEWYFERYLEFPWVQAARASQAKESITAYGHSLFHQIFTDKRAYGRYTQARAAGANKLRFEIIGRPDFHRWHWEALKDPDLPTPFVLDAPMVRATLEPPDLIASGQPSPTINLLLVVARPGGGRDVGYRTISRPLLEGLRQAHLPVNVEIVRPGTYRALVEHLDRVREANGIGYYHLVHFDLHGALLTYAQWQKGVESNRFTYQARYARDDVAQYLGQKAFLFFEGEETDKPDPAEADELAALLKQHLIPIAILNACQSGKQVGSSETSLGSRLLQAGVQTVVAMSYSVTVSAAEQMMPALYQHLFRQNDLPAAIRRARMVLHHQKERRANFDQRIDLEDWLLPVVYQSGGANGGGRLPLRDFTPQEQAAYHFRQSEAGGRYHAPEPGYGFVGRDVDILHVEKRLLSESEGKQRNLLLIRGLGGAGKTTLLRHLAEWWQTTRFVEEIFYFGYDEKAWTLPQIMDQIARQLTGRDPLPLGAAVPPQLAAFQVMNPAAQQNWLAQKLRATRHLLIVDNLESVTGEHLSIRNTLNETERNALRGFLGDLLDGATLVLLGTRGGEGWLVKGKNAPLREQDIYDLPGLDNEAASTLAERVLERHVTDPKRRVAYRQDEAFGRLLKLLAGYPLPLEVVLANLVRQTPTEVLAALQAGDVNLDAPGAADKTDSILRCIDYAHSVLDPAAQELLLCLAPFSGVIFAEFFPQYIEQLKEQPALAHLPFDQWQTVLQAAADWGLLSPHQLDGFWQLQPVFPYFLRGRLNGVEAAVRQAIETAFRLHYDEWSGTLYQLMESKEPQERQIGFLFTQLEYENVSAALDLALYAQVSIIEPYRALSTYLNSVQDNRRGLTLGQRVLAALEQYPADVLAGPLGAEFAMILIDDIGTRQLTLKQATAAEEAYQRALLLLKNSGLAPELIGKLNAVTYHQLGIVAEEQRQWAAAEAYYQQALAIDQEFGNRYSQASTYHQLGSVAQEQRQWAAAKGYYQQALAIFQAFNDRYSQATVYHQLGRVAQEQRQWAAAEAYYQQALAIKQEFNDRYSQASTYHQLGTVAQKQQQWPQAEEYYQQALAIQQEFKDRYSQVGTYHQLGSVAQAQRQWAAAEGYYQQALAIDQEFGNRFGQANTYHHLGIVAEEQRQWAAAEGYYQQALAIFQAFNDRYSQATVYHQLGMVAQKQEQWSQAEEYYQQALAIKQEFNDRHSQASTYHQLGTVAQKQQQWPQAEEYYQQALTIKQEFNDRYSQAGTFGQLGGLLAVAQEQWSQGANYLQQALTIFVEFQDQHSVGITLRNLALLWQAGGDSSLPAAVAAILGISASEVETLFRQINEKRGEGANTTE
jgi:tetratricopeptide (TPR) repeat protein